MPDAETMLKTLTEAGIYSPDAETADFYDRFIRACAGREKSGVTLWHSWNNASAAFAQLYMERRQHLKLGALRVAIYKTYDEVMQAVVPNPDTARAAIEIMRQVRARLEDR